MVETAPLGQLHTDPVVAGLDDDGVRLDHDDLAHDAADGGDGVALLQAVPHLLGLFLPLVLRADHKEESSANIRLTKPMLYIPLSKVDSLQKFGSAAKRRLCHYTCFPFG